MKSCRSPFVMPPTLKKACLSKLAQLPDRSFLFPQVVKEFVEFFAHGHLRIENQAR